MTDGYGRSVDKQLASGGHGFSHQSRDVNPRHTQEGTSTEGDENTWGSRLVRWADVKEHPRPGLGMFSPLCPVWRSSSLGATGSHRAMAHTESNPC